MSQSKKLTDDFTSRHAYLSHDQDFCPKELAQLSSTLANTTGVSRRRTVCAGLSKIPKVINKLEKNIQTLKKYCTELSKEKPLKKSKKASSKNLAPANRVPASSLGKSHPFEVPIEPEVDSIKQSYATAFGKQTNNLIELYNFYKAYMDKSGKAGVSSFTQSNNSTSIARVNNISLEGKMESMSMRLRNTPSILSQKQDSSVDDQSCNTHLFKDHLEKQSTNIFLDIDQEQSSGFSKSIICNQNSSQDRSLNIVQRVNTMMSSKGSEQKHTQAIQNHSKDIKALRQVPAQSTTHTSSNNTDRQTKRSGRICPKKQLHQPKKNDYCNLPLQTKTLRIDTEMDPNVEKSHQLKGQIKKFDLNLEEEMNKQQKSTSFEQTKKIKVSKILQSEGYRPQPTMKNPQAGAASPLMLPPAPPKPQKIEKTQDLPVKPPTITNILNINTQTIGDKKWSRPLSGTPHVQSSVNKPKSLEKPEQSQKIYEKNMLINKRKQQLNQKLKKQDKNSKLDINLDVIIPSELDQAILIEPISPVNHKNQQSRKQHQDLCKDLLKQGLLSKHDLSLWENMNILEQMYSTGELELKACKQNIFVEALEMIKKKKGFKKSKFYVQDLPPPKKIQKQAQVIDIESLSPQTIKQPQYPPKRKQTKTHKNNDSLEGISIDKPADDSLIAEIEGIQCQL